MNMQNSRRAAPRAMTMLVALSATMTVAGHLKAESLDFTRQGRNLSPLAGIFLFEPPVTASRDGFTATWVTASHALGESEGNNVVLIDGETSVLTATYTRSVGSDWRVSASLPHVWHSAGALDQFIDNWHAAFGFPDGIRDDVPRDELTFNYLRNGNTAVSIRRNQKGIGDVRLFANWSPAPLAAHGLSLALGLKLPTGDADKLTGSGNTDVSAALHWQPDWSDSRWSADASVGLARLGESDLNLGRQVETAWLGHVAMGYNVSGSWHLGGRIQVHRGPIKDAPDPLSEPSLLIIVGGSVDVAKHWRLDLTVDEDLNVETAPDVTFRLGLTRRFD